MSATETVRSPGELADRRRLMRDAIDATEVRELLGLAPRNRRSLLQWRQKPGFPRPVRKTRSGVELWDREAVLAFVRGQEHPSDA